MRKGLLAAAFALAVAGAVRAEQIPVAEEGQYSFRPRTVSWATSVNFAHGVARHQYRNMLVMIDVIHPENVKPISCGEVIVDEVVTDADERLLPRHAAFPPAPRSARPIGRPGTPWGPPENSFSVTLTVAGPAKPFKSIRSLKGSCVLTYSEGLDRVEVISPQKLEPGKPIAHEKLKGREVVLEAISADEVKLRMDAPVARVLSDIEFLDERGNKLRATGTSINSDGKTSTRGHRVKLPEGGRMVLLFNTEEKAVRIPIAMKDVSVEPAEPPQPPQGPQAPKAPDGEAEMEVF